MTGNPEPRQISSWQIAEQNAVLWMRYWGLVDARMTTGGGDSGIGVRASEALTQVKWEAHQVGRPALQRLVGARGRDYDKELLFFTGSGYSRHAIDYARDLEMALFRYDLVGSMTPVNSVARLLVERANTAHLSGTAPVQPDLPLEYEKKNNWRERAIEQWKADEAAREAAAARRTRLAWRAATIALGLLTGWVALQMSHTHEVPGLVKGLTGALAAGLCWWGIHGLAPDDKAEPGTRSTQPPPRPHPQSEPEPRNPGPDGQ